MINEKSGLIIPAKTRLEKLLSGITVYPQIYSLIDKFFNIPRLIDRTNLECLFTRRYQKVLDIGSGKGSMTVFLLKRAEKIVCLDSDKKELEVLKKRFKTKKNRLSFVVGDAKKLPFESNSFDLVFSNCVMEHIEEDEKALAEAARCLKLDGDLIMTFPNKDYEPCWFKKILFNHKFLQFLADPSLKKYFSFKTIKEAEDWFFHYRWQHVRRGYNLAEMRKQLAKYSFEIVDSFYYYGRLLAELWEIITFSWLNKFFPYSLIFFAPLFHLLPKQKGEKEDCLLFAILAKKYEKRNKN